MLTALGKYCEEALSVNGGHQVVKGFVRCAKTFA